MNRAMLREVAHLVTLGHYVVNACHLDPILPDDTIITTADLGSDQIAFHSQHGTVYASISLVELDSDGTIYVLQPTNTYGRPDLRLLPTHNPEFVAKLNLTNAKLGNLDYYTPAELKAQREAKEAAADTALSDQLTALTNQPTMVVREKGRRHVLITFPNGTTVPFSVSVEEVHRDQECIYLNIGDISIEIEA